MLPGKALRNISAVDVPVYEVYNLKPTKDLISFIEWLGREGQFAIQNLGVKWKPPLRYVMYYAIVIAIFCFGGKGRVLYSG